MKPLLTVLAAAGCLLGAMVLAQEDAARATDSPAEPVRHVVLLKFTAEATEAEIREVETAFAKLPDEIEQISDFEWGKDVSPEGLNRGFTHCFLVTFDSEEARDAYLPHPAHQKFVELLRPSLDEALVIDYQPQPAGE